MPNGLQPTFTGAAPTTLGAAPLTPTYTIGKTPTSFFGQNAGSIANILASLGLGGLAGGAFGGLQQQLGRGIGTEQQALAQSLGLLAPFQQTGATAVQRELGLLGEGGTPTGLVNQILSQFQQSPAQKATIQAGLEATRGRLGAQGLGQSGAEQEALEQFAQQQTAGQQQQFLQDVLGARGQTLGGLGQLGGLGLGAAQTGTQAQMQAAQNIASLLASQGEAGLGQAGTFGGLFSGLLGSIANL